MRPALSIATISLLALASAASAQPTQGQGPGGPPGGGGGMRGACQADVQKFCADTERGPARMQCMQSHQNDLSAECKAALAQMRARMQQNGGAGPGAPGPK
jgi:hypothetical protein